MHSTKPSILIGRVNGVRWRGALLDMTQASPMGEGSKLPLSRNIRLFMRPGWRIRPRAEWARKRVIDVPSGMPKQINGALGNPFEFIVTPKTVFILFGSSLSAPRRIYTDGRDWPLSRPSQVQSQCIPPS